MDLPVPQTLAEWNAAGRGYLPGLIGMTFDKADVDEVVASFNVRTGVKAWNGFLHAGAVVSSADTCCGYGTVRSLPEGASGFTTVELKSNFIGTAREGAVRCVARPVHLLDSHISTDPVRSCLAHRDLLETAPFPPSSHRRKPVPIVRQTPPCLWQNRSRLSSGRRLESEQSAILCGSSARKMCEHRRPVHRGRTTQVWDAVVEPTQGGKALAHFRCTQMILWPRGEA
jgi:uncharacterized protein (TIGR00369 family)